MLLIDLQCCIKLVLPWTFSRQGSNRTELKCIRNSGIPQRQGSIPPSQSRDAKPVSGLYRFPLRIDAAMTDCSS